jgi:multidrug efflux pump subunit AcrB
MLLDRSRRPHPGHRLGRWLPDDGRGSRRHGYEALARQQQADRPGQPDQGPQQIYTFFNTATPRVFADIDRRKADLLGVPPERVFEALNVYLGSAFVNDFNLLGRTYRVTAQADAPFRTTEADIANLKTRSNSGAMVPIGSVSTFEDKTGPYRVTRYNLFPAVEVDGDTAPGYSSGRRWTRWRSSRAIRCPAVTAPNGPASPSSRRRRAAPRARLRAGGGVRLPGAGRAI